MVFNFRSRQAGIDRKVIYAGKGAGLTNNFFGVVIPDDLGQIAHTRLYCPQPGFSLNDLDGSDGDLMMFGLSAIVGKCGFQISANKSGNRLFYKQICHQYEATTGIAINFFDTTGIWKVL
ncbi:MAG: hypothetical protein HC846_07815 [Blastocatellia bacterium]|nr:hypothetical protein [Blastocatellia bacterium]